METPMSVVAQYFISTRVVEYNQINRNRIQSHTLASNERVWLVVYVSWRVPTSKIGALLLVEEASTISVSILLMERLLEKRGFLR